MRGAGRVNHQAAAVADVGQVAEDLERFNEGLALRAAAAKVKAEDRAGATRQQLLRQRVAGVAGQHRVADARHQRVRGQKLDHFFGVAHVAGHAQRQGFDALQDEPGGVRAHAGAEVAQAFAAGAQQEGAHRAFFAEDHVVKAGVGLGELGKLARGIPIKRAAIDHQPADHGAVARQKFGGRVIDQVGAQLERFDQPGRGQGRVHQQRHPGRMGDGGHGLDVEHVQAGVADGFAKEELGVGPHGGAPGVMVAGRHKAGVDAETAQRVVQQVVRAAVQRGAGHNVRAGAHQGGNAQMQRGLAAGGGNGADAAFQRRYALLQHGIGRVADARVDMAGTLEVEQAGRVLARFKDEGGRQMDGHGPRAGAGVGPGACMQGQGVKAGVWVTGHAVSCRSLETRPPPMVCRPIVGYIGSETRQPVGRSQNRSGEHT